MLASAQRLQGDLEEAEVTAREGLSTAARKTGAWTGSYLMLELAASLLAVGNIKESAEWTGKALAMMDGESGKYWKANGLLRAGTILMVAGEPAQAVALFAAAEKLFEESLRPERWLQAEQERYIVSARETLGPDEFTTTWEAGRTLAADDTLAKALAWLDDVST